MKPCCAIFKSKTGFWNLNLKLKIKLVFVKVNGEIVVK